MEYRTSTRGEVVVGYLRVCQRPPSLDPHPYRHNFHINQHCNCFVIALQPLFRKENFFRETIVELES